MSKLKNDVLMEKYKNKLSIVILVHNRQYHLQRLCEYYIDFIKLYPIRTFIVDSSKEKWPGHKNFPDIKYEHYGPEKNFEKVLILEEISTEYVLLTADDDFYTKKGIIECLDFLLTNPDYSVAHGEYLRFDSLSAKLVEHNYGRKHYENFIKNEYFFKKAQNRILNYFDIDNFFMINHSIVKTKPLARAYRLRMNMTHLRPYRFSDAQFAIMQLLEGNVKVLPCVYGLRDLDRMITRGMVPKEKFPDVTFDEFPDAVKDKGDPYSPLLSEKDNISLAQASFVIGQAVQKLISGRKYNKYLPATKKNVVYPSETGKYNEDVNEIISLVKKHRESIPFYSKISIFYFATITLRARLGKLKQLVLNVYNCLSN